MDIEQKYVVTDNGGFAIFSKSTTHKDIGKVLFGVPVGAGFCNVRQKADSVDVNIHCYGESISLGIKSREEDGEIINRKLNYIE